MRKELYPALDVLTTSTTTLPGGSSSSDEIPDEILKLFLPDEIKKDDIKALVMSQIFQNPKDAIETIEKYPRSLKNFSFHDLGEIANGHERAINTIISQLSQQELLPKIIDTQQKFFILCFRFNIRLVVELLKDRAIQEMMMPVLKRLEYFYLQTIVPECKETNSLDSITRLIDFRMKPKKNGPHQKKLLETFLTTDEFANYALYDPEVGFYSKIVDFRRHFTTYSTHKILGRPLAAALAFQINKARQKLVAAKKISPKAKFKYLECGGGNGDLCIKILDIINMMAAQSTDPSWQDLNNTIEYHIVEISSKLAEIQRKDTKEFGKKVRIHEGNAITDLKRIFSSPNSIAMAGTNEFMDSVMSKVVGETSERGFVLQQVIPRISDTELKKFRLSSEKKGALKKNSERLFNLLKEYKYPNDGQLILAKQDYLELNRLNINSNLLVTFNMLPLNVVHVEHNPKLRDFITQNPDIFSTPQKSGGGYHVQKGQRDFLTALYDILIDQGEVITIDYCFDPNNYTHDHQFKVVNYKKDKYQPVGNNVFDSFLSDITVHVDMPTLAETPHYQLLFYGKQEQLRLDQFPPSVLSDEYKKYFEEQSSQGNFVVLVQQKLAKEEKVTQIVADPTRFVGEPLVITRAQIKQRLKDMFATAADYPHQALYQEAQKLYKDKKPDAYLKEVKQQNYTSALRKAAYACAKDLVALLLKYKGWLAKDFDINEKSPSESAKYPGMTAYDLVECGKANPKIKNNIKILLWNAGGRPSQTLNPPSIGVFSGKS